MKSCKCGHSIEWHFHLVSRYQDKDVCMQLDCDCEKFEDGGGSEKINNEMS